MTLALEDFEALCGFVSAAELQAALKDTPELTLCIGDEAAQAIVNAQEDGYKEVSKPGCVWCLCYALTQQGAVHT